MENNERQFKGVWISKDIWLDKRLNALEKIILVEIDSLDDEETGCYSSNKYLAEFCQCSETKISTAISKLIELNYIYVKSFDGRTRILKSRLSKNERQNLKILNADIKKVKEINKDNNKNNNINIIVTVIDYLNEKSGKHYKSTSELNKRHINARLNEGYTLDDFKKVIDIKCSKWLGDTKMETYLRPETLFGNKFESYLNESPKINDGKQANTRQYSKEEYSEMFDNINEIDI